MLNGKAYGPRQIQIANDDDRRLGEGRIHGIERILNGILYCDSPVVANFCHLAARAS